MDMRIFAETYVQNKAKENKLRDLIDRHKASLERLCKRNGGWIKNIVNPIAKRLEEHYPDYTTEVLGPFGLGARTSIHLYKKGLTTNNRREPDKRSVWDEPRGVLAITFEPGDLIKGELFIVNEKKDTGEFSRGTVGEVNGFNHPRMPMEWDEGRFMALFEAMNADR